MTQIRNLSDQEKIDWMRLIRTENIGPMTFYDLMRKFTHANNILDRLPFMAKNAGKQENIRIPSISDIEKEIDDLAKLGGQFIFSCEPNYSRNLSFVDDAPPVLATLGRIELLSQPNLSIVGARNSSINSEKFAFNIAQKMGAQGYVITSGLARGIDRFAHMGGLPTGTIGVLAGGIDQVYPPENQSLYDEMKEKGLILAESPLGVEPIARLFPKRNRIVSGLSKGVLVVEAALRSGSLITARMALEQGREVFAVPGSPFDPRCKGTNHLLKEGASLVEKVDDILAIFDQEKQVAFLDESESAYEAGANVDLDEKDVSIAREEILNKIGSTIVDLNDLMHAIESPKPYVLTALLELELAGKITRESGGKIYRLGDVEAVA